MSLYRAVASLVALSYVGYWGFSATADRIQEPAQFQFAISVDRGSRAPVYVLRETTTGQPGWIEVFHNGQRVYLVERCELEDCGQNRAVCGLTVPVIEDLTSSASSGTITLEWDRVTSEVDATLQCEVRTRVSADNLLARFCYALEAELEGGRDAPGPGSLVDPICVEREFSSSEESLVLRVASDGSTELDDQGS